MTDRPGDAQRVGGRGKLIVALVVLATVAALVVFVLGRDDRRSTPLEDAAAGRAITAEDPAAAASADALPQGRQAPDSNEGATGAGSPYNTGEAQAPAADTGRNAPAGDSRAAQRTPDGSLTEGPDRAPAPAAPVGR
jgi:hypothetical protein